MIYFLSVSRTIDRINSTNNTIEQTKHNQNKSGQLCSFKGTLYVHEMFEWGKQILHYIITNK